jgi:hypothetical protein
MEILRLCSLPGSYTLDVIMGRGELSGFLPIFPEWISRGTFMSGKYHSPHCRLRKMPCPNAENGTASVPHDLQGEYVVGDSCSVFGGVEQAHHGSEASCP